MPDGQRFTNGGRQIVAISPDGTRIVYVANQQLYTRRISELHPRPIPGTEGDGGVLNPAFSPDGGSLAFWSAADGTLKTIAVDGGAPVTICAADRPNGIRWTRSGILVGQGGKGIIRVAANGGRPESIVTVSAGEIAYGPELLPDGRTLLFTLAAQDADNRWDTAQLVAQSLATGDRRVILDGGSDARYVPTGHLVYAQGGLLFAVPFDPERLSIGGRIPVVEGVRRSDGGQTGVAQFSVSDTGSLIYVPGPVSGLSATSDLAFSDRTGAVEKLNVPSRPYYSPRVSPDGKLLAVGVDDGSGANIWIYDLSKGTAMRQLTVGGRNRYPIWSADGRRVAFQSDREGDRAIFWQRADGTDSAQRLTTPERGVAHVPQSWSRTDERFLFIMSTASGSSLWTFSVPDAKAEPFGEARSAFSLHAIFSPDGRWVAYSVFTSGDTGLFVEPVPRTGAKYRISQNGIHPLWSPDGKELFYSTGGLYAVTVTTGRGFEFSSPQYLPKPFQNPGPTVARAYDVMPDGQRMIGTVPPGSGQAGVSSEINVVLNWFGELKQQVPREK